MKHLCTSWLTSRHFSTRSCNENITYLVPERLYSPTPEGVVIAWIIFYLVIYIISLFKSTSLYSGFYGRFFWFIIDQDFSEVADFTWFYAFVAQSTTFFSIIFFTQLIRFSLFSTWSTTDSQQQKTIVL